MAATSKHYGDISLWIEKVIESSTNFQHYKASRKLVSSFDRYLERNTNLPYDERHTIIRKLSLKLDEIPY